MRFVVQDMTILDPDIEMPGCRGDIFSIKTQVRSRAKLLQEIEKYAELEEYFESEFVIAVYDYDPIAVRVDSQEGSWRDWVLKGSLAEHKERLSHWLEGDLDPEEIPESFSPMGAAYRYFLSLDWDLVEKLGVVIVEGEHPGSSYYAAELRVPVEEANAFARELELPLEFLEQPG